MIVSIDLDGPDPLWEQITAVLEQRIRSGTYKPNRRIPASQSLADEFGVSRPTVTRALRMLAGRGLVRTVRGKGTFALKPPADAADVPADGTPAK